MTPDTYAVIAVLAVLAVAGLILALLLRSRRTGAIAPRSRGEDAAEDRGSGPGADERSDR